MFKLLFIFEFIRNYVDHEKLPVKLIGGGRDKDYGYLGFSHWAEEDRIKNAKRQALIDKDRALLQKQVRDRRDRIKQEKDEQRKYEVDLIKRMKKELETVRKKELEAKINDKKRLAKFLAGNALVREQKEARKKKLAEEDVQRMKEYAKMLEKQEKARESYFADMTKIRVE